MMGCLASPAWAQRAGGPFAGLFGGNQNDAKNRSQGLDFNGSLFGVYNDNVPASSDVPLDPRYHESGLAEGASAALTYTRNDDGLHFTTTGTGSVMSFSSDPGLLGSLGGSAFLSSNLTTKVSYAARGSISYAPFYQFAPFLPTGTGFNSAVPPPTFGLATVSQKNLGMDAGVSLTDSFTKRTSGTVDVFIRDWSFPDSPQSGVRSWGGHAYVHHSLTRNLGLHAGYGLEQIEYDVPSQSTFANQTFDVGADYGDTLMFSRRTAFSFGVSTQAIGWEGSTHFRINGSAVLTHGLSRSWSAALSYARSTDFTPGFTAPLLSDSVYGSLSGQLSRRTQLVAIGGYSTGNVGFIPHNDFGAYSAMTRLTFALTRTVGAYAQYYYYHYHIPADATTLALVPILSRHGVAGGLTVWIPLINDTRTPRDSR
jgi:hypothetical protein